MAAAVKNRPPDRRVLLQIGGQLLFHQVVDHAANLPGAQLRFRLALELRVFHFDGHNRRQAFLRVLRLQVRLVVAQELILAAVVVDGARQGGGEAGQMRAAVGGRDVVDEGVDVFGIRVVVLHGDFHEDAVLHALGINRFREQNFLVVIQILDELAQPAFVEEILRHGRFAALIGEGDVDALVQERHFAQALLQHVKIKRDAALEDAVGVVVADDVGQEADRRAGAVGFADDAQVVEVLAARVLLLINFPILINRHGQRLRQRIDHRRAHAVQAAGHLVAAAAELAARVQHRQADLDRRTPHFRVDADGEAAPVVADGDRAVLVQRHVDALAVARQRLIHGVIHNFVHQMVQSAAVRRADVHAGALANRLQALQHLNLLLAVFALDLRRFFNLLFDFFFRPVFEFLVVQHACTSQKSINGG